MEKKSDGDDEDEHGNTVETGILLLGYCIFLFDRGN
jgi:hypothetical protein